MTWVSSFQVKGSVQTKVWSGNSKAPSQTSIIKYRLASLRDLIRKVCWSQVGRWNIVPSAGKSL